MTVRNNVIDNVGGVWLSLNTQSHIAPRRTALDNVAMFNWYNSGRLNGEWTGYINNRASGDIKVDGLIWPIDARRVINMSGFKMAYSPDGRVKRSREYPNLFKAVYAGWESACRINTVNLENILGQIEADRGNLHAGWPLCSGSHDSNPSWHSDAVSGSHPHGVIAGNESALVS